MEKEQAKPELNIRAGSVRAAIWKNQRQVGNGQYFESVKVVMDRTYVDKSGNYQNTHSLDVNDIPKAIYVLGKAYAYLIGQRSTAETEDIPDQVVLEQKDL